MAENTPLTSVQAIDLDRHGVIEASAGTGKTYTMVGLACRVLRETPTTIDRLLMITFTEKAAGEMRERLRLSLEAALAGPIDGVERQRVLNALDGFAQARISTIHAFCGRLLQEHAFEGQQPLSTTVEDESPLLLDLLIDRIRRWGALDEGALELALKAETKPRWAGNADRWMGTVAAVASQYRPEAGDRLVPEPVDGLEEVAEAVLRAAEEVRRRLDSIRQLVPGGVDPAVRPEDHRLSVELKEIKDSGPTRIGSLLTNYVHPLIELLATPPEEPLQVLLATSELLSGIRKATKGNRQLEPWHDRPFPQLYERLRPEWSERCPYLVGIAKALADLDAWVCEMTPPSLAATAARDLRRDLEIACQARGLMTYSRMIGEVHHRVTEDGPGGPLATALRESLDVAIVDEFQDTDRLQWEIIQTALLDGGEPSPRVYIVGDPKQSIYGFRGADVHTYEAACKHLIEECGADRYSLGTNYRARREVVEACNWLFTRGEWFGPEWGAEVSPAGQDAKVQEASASVGEAGMVFVRLEPETATPARRALGRYIADTIARLCPREGAGAATLTLRGGKQRAVRYDDFCILVRRRSEVRLNADALRDAGIPYTFYKATGLWASDEALQLHALMRALADPSDPRRWRSALLSRFFSSTPADAMGLSECSDTHPARQVFQSWATLAERRDWPALLRRILDASPILLDDMDEAPSEWERRLTNYEHLCHILEEQAVRRGWDVTQVVAHIAERRAAATVAEDEDQLRIETSEPKVQIMTMHVAKGLEFPFVFVAGGLSSGTAGMPVQRRYEGADGTQGHWVIDLTADAKDDDPDAKAELRRLYYVAITRAAAQVHIPLYSPERSPGPLVWLVSEKLAEARRGGTPAVVREVCWEDDGGYRRPELPAIDPAPAPATTGPSHVNAAVLNKPLPNLGRLCAPIASYTSLAERPAQTASAGGGWLRLDDDTDDDAAWSDLPGGAGVGQFFHEALEGLLLREDLPAALEGPGLASYLWPIARNWVHSRWLTSGFIPSAQALIVKALTADLPHLGRLTVLGRANLLPELPFLYPVDLFPEDAPLPPGVRVLSGMVTGVIDLVARAGDRYFILDWKSNRLPGYGPDNLDRAMREGDYHLQYSIYAVALDRWLRAHLSDRYDPAQHLGGVLYVFLRGLAEDGSRGVYVRSGSDLRPQEYAGRDLPRLIERSLGGDDDGR